MPTEYEFKTSPPPQFDKHPTIWMVRERPEGKEWGHWRRLHCTPKGAYYLMAHGRKRVPYNGPEPA